MNLIHFNSSGFPLVAIPLIIFFLAGVALIIMGVINLTSGAGQQTSVVQETNVFIGNNKSGSTVATKSGRTKIIIGACILFISVTATAILIIM